MMTGKLGGKRKVFKRLILVVIGGWKNEGKFDGFWHEKNISVEACRKKKKRKREKKKATRGCHMAVHD